ncbi:hypothetical protein BG015_003480 [Linnemannia schmuckeri]|uniref:Uncharacterized protein n=1 Tax=Linnemannia schmuckeri TaxID=64567 RepID=A0A9P5V426_9FUNG|nr:hypothetical protein BG015_003480 [Linnemannia schmuckeri]
MSFALTSPELLDLDSYQRTLKRLIAVLASLNSNINISKRTTGDSGSAPAAASTLEVNLDPGAAFILDTTFISNNNSNSNNTDNVTGDSHRLSAHQSYPLSFVASGQLPALQTPPLSEATTCSTSASATTKTTKITTTTVQALPVLYYIRLPWNPQTHGIQCRLSARRLSCQHVVILDRVLRRLCDASPGAFMVGYSDGLSGVDAGTEVVYSGENSWYAQERHHHHHNHHQHSQSTLRTMTGSGPLDQSIAIARDRGDMDLDHRVAGLVGHVDHHHYHHPHPTIAETAIPSVLLKKTIKGLKEDFNTHQNQLQSPPPQQQKNTATNATVDVQNDSLVARSLIENDVDILNYDFGLTEDVDQWVHVQGSVDIDHLHDTLWVK